MRCALFLSLWSHSLTGYRLHELGILCMRLRSIFMKKYAIWPIDKTILSVYYLNNTRTDRSGL